MQTIMFSRTQDLSSSFLGNQCPRKAGTFSICKCHQCVQCCQSPGTFGCGPPQTESEKKPGMSARPEKRIVGYMTLSEVIYLYSVQL
jgi:hypothetical protein